MMNKQHRADTQHSSQTESSQPVKSLLKSWQRSQENRSQDLGYITEIIEERSHLLLPLLGYSLLVFALLDFIHIIIPLNFTNPAWELRTIGALVEHAAIPLLGLVLVFYRHQGYIIGREKNLLGCLSWVCLLMGLLYLLMVPLGVADTWRIHHASNAQISAQSQQHQRQFQWVKGQLNQAKTDEQIRQQITSLVPKVRSEDIKNPQTFKDQFISQLSEGERQSRVKAGDLQANQTLALIKDSVKWNLGALVAGTALIWMWRLTEWARRME